MDDPAESFPGFFYNMVGIPLAAPGFLSPVLCALALGLSDLVVIGNALRLLRRKPLEAKKAWNRLGAAALRRSWLGIGGK